jgi:hypothetical protein
MRKLLILVALFTTFLGFSQNLEQFIPADTEIVISANGNHLLQLVSVEELNNFMIGREILKNVNRRKEENQKFKGLDDFGFDLNSKAYYFHQANDSISYHSFIIKLNNRANFEKLLGKELKDVVKKDGYSIKKGWGDLSIWNDNMLLFIGINPNRAYMDENEERLRNGDDDTSFYSIKKDLATEWATQYALKLLSKKEGTIAFNSSYMNSKDAKADATLWVKNYGEVIKNSLESIKYFLPRNLRNMPEGNADMYGISTVTSKLYFETEKIRMDVDMKVTDNWKDAYKKMYSSKLDKRFFKYFDQNKALAYMSMSVDTKAALDAYPRIATSLYGGALPGFQEEMNVGADLVSLLLDEEAISNLITGDMLFVLNDLGEKEVTYTTYEYDDDYNSTEVTKTKMEIRPDFTIMIGSENSALINRFANIGVKHHVIDKTAGYYKFKTPDSVPFELYAIMKDGLLIITTSDTTIANISTNNFHANSGKHKKLMRKNATVFYANPKAIIARLPAKEGTKNYELNKYAQENLVGSFLATSKMIDNHFHSTATFDTKATSGNALKYIFNFIEDMSKF